MQLAIVLKTLVGADEMQRMMVEAIGVAKQADTAWRMLTYWQSSTG